MSKSQIFTEYNKLKAKPGIDQGRLNRGLGVAQRKQARPYTTTTRTCNCPDSHYRHGMTCKHQYAARMTDNSPKQQETQLMAELGF